MLIQRMRGVAMLRALNGEVNVANLARIAVGAVLPGLLRWLLNYLTGRCIGEVKTIEGANIEGRAEGLCLCACCERCRAACGYNHGPDGGGGSSAAESK
jgi:hypothetical protein